MVMLPLVLFAFIALGSSAIINVTRCPSSLHPSGDWSNTTMLHKFHLAEVRPLKAARQQTIVHLCHTDTHLRIRFDSNDDNAHSRFTQCNDPLYKDSAVETFITGIRSNPNDVDLHHYTELELSPNGVLFASHIHNPDLTCPGIVGNNIPCNVSGLAYKAEKNLKAETWWAYLSVPFSLLNGQETQLTPEAGPTFFKANFFRIDQPLNFEKEYSAWSSPSSPHVPCFHVPPAFGVFVINQ
eukprot:TRINITY_DN6891_c0_g1_i1.p1 TRINITY_DN6891_c0_g1~~TRINITY_DN6891_c0_g1_i1.p1  ORF type:complete len:240 (+),score=45.83 TRINITY_DN6891_c0_g1_i1:115-834(+)